MKPLKPSIRERKRYLLIKGENLKENITKSIIDFIGVLGMSETSLKFIEINGNSGIISINRGSLNKVRASLALNKNKIFVKKVSGTLKGLRENKP